MDRERQRRCRQRKKERQQGERAAERVVVAQAKDERKKAMARERVRRHRESQRSKQAPETETKTGNKQRSREEARQRDRDLIVSGGRNLVAAPAIPAVNWSFEAEWKKGSRKNWSIADLRVCWSLCLSKYHHTWTIFNTFDMSTITKSMILYYSSSTLPCCFISSSHEGFHYHYMNRTWQITHASAHRVLSHTWAEFLIDLIALLADFLSASHRWLYLQPVYSALLLLYFKGGSAFGVWYVAPRSWLETRSDLLMLQSPPINKHQSAIQHHTRPDYSTSYCELVSESGASIFSAFSHHTGV